MSQIPPRLFDFAERLLRREAEQGDDPQGFAGALQRACGALHEQLAPLISSTGFQTLMARALKLASRDFPFLATVTVATHPGGCLSGVPDVREEQRPDDMAEALTAVLAHFIWLLVIFIGENLGLRKVRDAWPEVPFDTADSASGTQRS